MTKKELIETIANKTELSQNDVNKTINAFTETLTDILSNNDKLTLVGFGTFSTAQRASREGRNPATGKVITIPKATVAKFKAGNNLKEAINK